MIEAMGKRVSVRSYRPFDGTYSIEKTKEVINKETKESIFDTNLNIKIIDDDFLKKNEIKRIGTYGVITGNPSYFFASTKKENNKNELVGYGYILQKAVLELTNLGLGTCWLGADFNKKLLKEAFEIKNDEYIPAVISFGLPKEKENPLQRAMRKSGKRKDFEKLFFEDGDKPLKEESLKKYKEVLECVRIAPSSINNQPWRLIIDDNKIHFFMYSKIKYNFLYLDMGIAMCHFDLARQEKNIDGSFKVLSGVEHKGYEYIASFVVE